MIIHKDIIDFVVHTIYCESCGKELKIKLKKNKFPHENSHQGTYWHKGVVTCYDCESKNNYKVQLFYSISPKKSKIQNGKKQYIKSYKHRILAFCRTCNNFDITDCESTSCPFYGIKRTHKVKQQDEDFWWATRLSNLKKSHDRFYKGKCKKKIKGESKDSSTIQTTEKSSKKSE